MSGSGKAGNGRGSNRKRPFKRRENNTWQGSDSEWTSAGTPQKRAREPDSPNLTRQNRGSLPKTTGENSRGEQKRASFFERPKWVPPKINTDPLPIPDCPWCGKPIRDLSQAIADRETGVPVHFDCVAARIAGRENLDKGEAITYIGGGRFGIVHFGGSGLYTKNSHDKTEGREFRIKKIIEWEKKDQRAEWRSVICDHYSIT